jgi:hypothetical protein
MARLKPGQTKTKTLQLSSLASIALSILRNLCPPRLCIGLRLNTTMVAIMTAPEAPIYHHHPSFRLVNSIRAAWERSCVGTKMCAELGQDLPDQLFRRCVFLCYAAYPRRVVNSCSCCGIHKPMPFENTGHPRASDHITNRHAGTRSGQIPLDACDIDDALSVCEFIGWCS